MNFKYWWDQYQRSLGRDRKCMWAHTHTHTPTEVPCDKGLAEVKDPTVVEVVQTENTVDILQT